MLPKYIRFFNKLNMKMKNLLALKNVLTNGIDIEWTSMHYQVKPKLKRASMCLKCCTYEHYTYGCKNAPKCGTCGGDHLTVDCRNPNKSCYWCKSSTHSAGNDSCVKHFQTNYELNKFIVDFMIGEGICKHIYEALGTKTPEGYSGNEILIEEDDIIDRNDFIREQFTEHWQVASDELKTEIATLKARVNTNEILIKEVHTEVTKLDKKVNEAVHRIENKITSLHENQLETNEQLKHMETGINEHKQQMKQMETGINDNFKLILATLTGSR